jgi:hypothetical protein
VLARKVKHACQRLLHGWCDVSSTAHTVTGAEQSRLRRGQGTPAEGAGVAPSADALDRFAQRAEAELMAGAPRAPAGSEESDGAADEEEAAPAPAPTDAAAAQGMAALAAALGRLLTSRVRTWRRPRAPRRLLGGLRRVRCNVLVAAPAGRRKCACLDCMRPQYAVNVVSPCASSNRGFTLRFARITGM